MILLCLLRRLTLSVSIVHSFKHGKELEAICVVAADDVFGFTFPRNEVQVLESHTMITGVRP